MYDKLMHIPNYDAQNYLSVDNIQVAQPQQNWDRCHCFRLTYSIDVRKYPNPISFLGCFFPPSFSLSFYYDVNRMGWTKAVTHGHQIQLLLSQRIRKHKYKTLGTCVINSPIYPPPPSKCQKSILELINLFNMTYA